MYGLLVHVHCTVSAGESLWLRTNCEIVCGIFVSSVNVIAVIGMLIAAGIFALRILEPHHPFHSCLLNPTLGLYASLRTGYTIALFTLDWWLLDDDVVNLLRVWPVSKRRFNLLINGFSSFGKIVSTKAIIDPQTNLCKGYGFVDFDRFDSADMAVQQLKAKGVQAQKAKVIYVYTACSRWCVFRRRTTTI